MRHLFSSFSIKGIIFLTLFIWSKKYSFDSNPIPVKTQEIIYLILLSERRQCQLKKTLPLITLQMYLCVTAQTSIYWIQRKKNNEEIYLNQRNFSLIA